MNDGYLRRRLCTLIIQKPEEDPVGSKHHDKNKKSGLKGALPGAQIILFFLYLNFDRTECNMNVALIHLSKSQPKCCLAHLSYCYYSVLLDDLK